MRSLLAPLLCLTLSCALPPSARAEQPSPAAPPDPMLALKDREINLLKQRARTAEAELKENRLARLIAETQLRVAALREFKVTEVVRHEPLTQQVITDLINKTLDQQFPGRKLDLFIWSRQLFGALPEGIDLRAFYSSLIGEQAGGLYDPGSKTFYCSPNFKIEGTLGTFILSHEICHALQDQNFDLEGMGLDDPGNADASLVTLCLAEGDATLLMSEYMTEHGNAATLLSDLPSMLAMDQTQLNNAPQAVREELIFPYLGGAKFFQELGGRTRSQPERYVGLGKTNGWRSDIFREPPQTTEQIIHPEKYLQGELPREIAPLPHDEGATAIQSPVGEFGVAALLIDGVGKQRAYEAAAGWDGDRMLATEDAAQKQRTLTWQTHWDTDQDAQEFVTALSDTLAVRFANKLKWKTRNNAQTAKAQGGTLRIEQSDPRSVRLEITMPVRESAAQKD
jgi:hypothetical protein